MNPIINNNPTAPKMPEPDNPLKVLKPILILAIIALIGWQAYTSFSSWLTENNMTFEEWLAMIDEEEYDDDEDDAVEDWISGLTEVDPIDTALKQFLKDNYGALCDYSDDIPNITAPEGYHLTAFTCMGSPHGIYAYGKLDENGLISDVHTNFLYNYYKNDVRLTVASGVNLYYRSPEVVVLENADWVASHPAEIDPTTGYAKKIEKKDISYIVDVYLPSKNNNVSKSVLLRIGRTIAMSLPNCHITFYYLEDGADSDPTNRVAGVDYGVIGEIDCIAGEVLVK